MIFLWFIQFQEKFVRKTTASFRKHIFESTQDFLGVFHLSMKNIRENCIWIVVPALPMQNEIRLHET